jgi:hypothetical protein
MPVADTPADAAVSPVQAPSDEPGGWRPLQNNPGDVMNWISARQRAIPAAALGMRAGGLVPPRGSVLDRGDGGASAVRAGSLRPQRSGRGANRVPGHLDDAPGEEAPGALAGRTSTEDEALPTDATLDTDADADGSATLRDPRWQPLPDAGLNATAGTGDALQMLERLQRGELCWTHSLRLAMRCAQMHPGADIFVQAFMLVDIEGNVLPSLSRRARLRADEQGQVHARSHDAAHADAGASPDASSLLDDLESAPLLGLSLHEALDEAGEPLSALHGLARTDLAALRHLFERALPAGLHNALRAAQARLAERWRALTEREDFEQHMAHHGDAIQRVLDQGDIQLSVTLRAGDLHAYRAQANWQRARAQMRDWAARGRLPDFDALLAINRLLGEGLAPWNRPEQAQRAGARFGVLRHFDVVCGVPPRYFLSANELLQAMLELFDWYRTQWTTAAPLWVAAQMHQRLLTLHPFADANGRSARLVLEWLLRLAGLPPAALRSAEIALFVYEGPDANPPAGSAERQLMDGLDKGLALHLEWLQIDEQTGA